MEFNEYQDKATSLATYPDVGSNMVYPALGLAGEAGEVAEKIKKQWRNLGNMDGKKLSENDRNAIVKEIGDVLWYAAALAKEIGVTLSSGAVLNLVKLFDRRERDVIKSEGDTR